MENDTLIEAITAISSGEFNESDIKIIKNEIISLNKSELKIKREMEKNKNEFVKKKDKSTIELRAIRGNIKKLKQILKLI